MANDVSAAVPTIMAQGLLALREFCVMPRLVNTDFGDEVAEKGDTIDVTIPSAVAVSDVQPASYAPNPGDVIPTKVQVPLEYWREAPFQLSDKDLAEAMDGIRPQQVSEAVRALANDVNEKVFAKYLQVYGYVGTAGTTPFGSGVGIVSATQARKVLNKQLAPLANRRMVLDPDAEANALGLDVFNNYDKTRETDAIIEGMIGRKLGFNFFSDQQVPTHTAGTLVNGSSARAAKVNGAVAVGEATMDIDESTLTGTVVPGDIFTVAGHDQTYVITNTTTKTASSNAIAGLTFSPAAKEAFADDAVVTFKASHVVNLGFHRDAFALAVRPLGDQVITESDRNTIQTVVDPVSQLALRLEVRREHKRTRWSFDILYGVALVRPELAMRLAG